MINVLFCASEVAPFAKTGGLGDVTGSLPVALGKLGVRVAVVTPRYRGIQSSRKKLSEKVTVHFVENEAYFNRASLYGNDGGDYPDNLERFSFFSRAALGLARETGFKPDIIHVHDWQTALIPVILKTKLSRDPFFQNSKTLLTVHNLAYQGHFSHSLYPKLGLDPGLFSMGGFEFYGKINLLKAGLLYADALNTVSPTYAREIQTKEYGFGLEGVIHQRRGRLKGILNGIDTALWGPEKDRRIKKTFSAKRLDGKAACKAELQKSGGLEVNPRIPVFGIVSRLAEQKGMDVLLESADALLSRKAQLVLLGDGDAVYKRGFGNVGRRHPGSASVHIGFNAAEAHKIYAGSDFFLMPSHFEPCGLGQMISLRYGTLPIVRRTGGLADTIEDADADPKHGNGFVFEDRRAHGFLGSVDRAIRAFRDTRRFDALRRHAMKMDFSWDVSATEYVKYYKEIMRG
ncbi:MAG: glycogen synthase GlgA [Candidatus Omnitrophota bacterium]